MLNDTLLGFVTLAESTTEQNIVVWINEYFGPVAPDGKPFDQMQVYLDNQPNEARIRSAKQSALCGEKADVC